MSDETPDHQPPLEQPIAAHATSAKGAPKWTKREGVFGMITIELSEWRFFPDLLDSDFRKTENYIWRGQRDDSWSLRSTFNRLLKKLGKDGVVNDERLNSHLTHFEDSMLGRRGVNPPELDEDEVWALGQHNGLATPLLDWTRSPFVAAFFAFCEQTETPSKRCAVFALNQRLVQLSGSEDNQFGIKTIPIKIFRPASHENQRLINQAGLFTRLTNTPSETSVEDCLFRTLKKNSPPLLYKIIIPNIERELVLRTLNRMNINHATLFPDLYGAATFANAQTEMEAKKPQ
jgi:hypothetical protein